MATKMSKPAKITPAKKVRGKGEFYKILAEHSCLKRKDIACVFDTMGKVIAADLSKSGPRVVNIPGMMKIVAKEKPAVKGGEWKNPFTGQMEMRKPRPATTVVKIRALKGLKCLV